jgi:hypothetical protein
VVQAAIIAPPLEHFIALLRQLKESHSKLGRHGNTMAWCLFEALRDDERKFLATASCMSLAQDSRAGRLLTRWVACGGSDRELVVRSGVLQLHRGQAVGAVALQVATWKRVRTFATCRRGGN